MLVLEDGQFQHTAIMAGQLPVVLATVAVAVPVAVPVLELELELEQVQVQVSLPPQIVLAACSASSVALLAM